MLSVVFCGFDGPLAPEGRHGLVSRIRVSASLLCDPDDEIVVADHAGEGLPTPLEQVADRLDPATLARIRLLRLRDADMRELGVPADEAMALGLNAAIRRSSPRNRWIMLACSDALPDFNGSASDFASLMRDLPIGAYLIGGVPEDREAPTWCLCRRSDLFAVAGFDEMFCDGVSAWQDLIRRLATRRGGVIRVAGLQALKELMAGAAPDHRLADGSPLPTLAGASSARPGGWGLPGRLVEETALGDDAEPVHAPGAGDPDIRILAATLRHRDRRAVFAFLSPRPALLEAVISFAAKSGFRSRILTTAQVAAMLGGENRSEVQIVSPAKLAAKADIFILDRVSLAEDGGPTAENREHAAADDQDWSDHRSLVSRAIAAEERDRLLNGDSARLIIDFATRDGPAAVLPETVGSFERAGPGGGKADVDNLAAYLAKRLGRVRSLSRAEMDSLFVLGRQLMTEDVVKPEMHADLRRHAGSLSAYLDSRTVARLVEPARVRAARERLQALLSAQRGVQTLPFVTNRPPVARRPLSGLASFADWDDPHWLAFARRVSGERAAEQPRLRTPWIWERAQFLYALDRVGRAHPLRRLLVVCELPEAGIENFASVSGSVDLLDVRCALDLHCVSRNADHFLAGRRLEPGAVELVDGRAFADGDRIYDAILLPHGSALAGGLDRFPDLLARLDAKLDEKGVMAVAADVRLSRGEPLAAVDLGLTEGGWIGRIRAETGLDYVDGLDMTLAHFDAALVVAEHETPFGLWTGDSVAWPALFALTKTRATTAAEWERVFAARHDRDLGDQTSRLSLSPGSRRTGKAIEAAPREELQTVFFGPYLDLPDGAYEATLVIAVPGSVFRRSRMHGYVEIMVGNTQITRAETRIEAWLHRAERKLTLPFDLSGLRAGRLEIRAVAACNVPVHYIDVRIRRLR